jgi:hypothetical protein
MEISLDDMDLFLAECEALEAQKPDSAIYPMPKAIDCWRYGIGLRLRAHKGGAGLPDNTSDESCDALAEKLGNLGDEMLALAIKLRKLGY